MQGCVIEGPAGTIRLENKTRASANNRGGAGDPFRLPTDLREWVDPWQLREWVVEETAKLAWERLIVVRISGRPVENRPRMILSLLAFAYLSQVFSSSEVVERCETDGMFRFLCGSKAPSVQELITFRRRNREVLETVMAGAFLRGLVHKFDLNMDPPPVGLEVDLRERARERLDIARHMDVA